MTPPVTPEPLSAFTVDQVRNKARFYEGYWAALQTSDSTAAMLDAFADLLEARAAKPEPSPPTEIQTLRDQALDPKRQMTVDRESGLVDESLVERRLILAVCEVARRGLTREQLAIAQRDGAWRELDALRIERDAIAAQLTEVTRERDDAKLALSVVQNAAKTLVRGADGRVLNATKHEPAARVAIATLDSEREMNAILTQQLEAAEAALAQLRAVVEAAKKLRDAHDSDISTENDREAALDPLFDALAALPADPSAPTLR